MLYNVLFLIFVAQEGVDITHLISKLLFFQLSHSPQYKSKSNQHDFPLSTLPRSKLLHKPFVQNQITICIPLVLNSPQFAICKNPQHTINFWALSKSCIYICIHFQSKISITFCYSRGILLLLFKYQLRYCISG